MNNTSLSTHIFSGWFHLLPLEYSSSSSFLDWIDSYPTTCCVQAILFDKMLQDTRCCLVKIGRGAGLWAQRGRESGPCLSARADAVQEASGCVQADALRVWCDQKETNPAIQTGQMSPTEW